MSAFQVRSGTRPLGRLLLVVLLLSSAPCTGGESPGPTAPDSPPETPAPTTVSLSRTNVELTAFRATYQFTVTVLDQNGTVMPAAAVSWTSSAPQVVAVSSEGLVTALDRSGAATISAASGSASAEAEVTIRQVTTSIFTDIASLDLRGQGDAMRIEVYVEDSGGYHIPNAPVSWSSSDETIATVETAQSLLLTGVAVMVTAVASGSATVTVTTIADGGPLSHAIPISVGEAVLVRPPGGVVTLADGAVTLDFPPGAVSTELFVTAEAVTDLPSWPTPIPGTAFTVEPGTFFAEPVTVTIGYDPTAVPAGEREEDLRLYRLEYGVFTDISGSTVDVTEHAVSGDIQKTYFGLAALLPFTIQPPADPCSDDQGTVTVSVGAGLAPVFDWDPACAVGLVVVEENGSDQWLIFTDDDTWDDPVTANLIGPPITYGEHPPGVMMRRPAEPLATGVTYSVTLWRAISATSGAACVSRLGNACMIASYEFAR